MDLDTNIVRYVRRHNELGITHRQAIVLACAECWGQAALMGDLHAALAALSSVDPESNGLWIRELGPAFDQLSQCPYDLEGYPTMLLWPMSVVSEEFDNGYMINEWLGNGQWLHEDSSGQTRLDGSRLVCVEHLYVAEILGLLTTSTSPLITRNWKREGF